MEGVRRRDVTIGGNPFFVWEEVEMITKEEVPKDKRK